MPQDEKPEEMNGNHLEELARAAYESVVDGEDGRNASILEAVLGVGEVRSQLRLPDLPAEDGSTPSSVAHSLEPTEGEVFEHYDVHDRIARGGMGVVLRGRDRTLGREVAIKVLDPRHAGNPALVQRFIEEAQIGGQLQHPGIVPVIELGRCADRRPFFAMKLVKGRTLASLLKKRPDSLADRRRFLDIFERVCQTMAYAHARSVVHRDLKPANVMVGAFGEVQVMDWGLAKVLGQSEVETHPPPAPEERTVIETVRSSGTDSRSQAGSVMGTPAYMPPEQARGDVEQVDQRADVFALGAVACEILTGEPPYVGESFSEVRQKAQAGNLTEALARLGAAGLDPALDHLVRGCLAQEREDRPRDAGEVAETLSSYLASVEERIRTAEVGAARAQTKAAAERRVRNRTLVAAVSVVAALVLTTAAYLWTDQNKRERQRRIEGKVTLALEEAAAARERALGAPRSGPPRWAEAKLAATRARTLSDDELVGPELHQRAVALVARVEQDARAAREAAEEEDRNRRMRERLEAIRTPPGAEYQFNFARRRDQYAKAFREYGIDMHALSEEETAARIRRSPIVDDLVAALDFWAYACRRTAGAKESARLGRLAQRVDPVPFRRDIRAAYQGKKPDRLRAMAASPEALAQPPAVLEQLAFNLGWLGDMAAALALLERASVKYPGDFWVRYRLVDGLGRARPSRDEEALPHAHAALAIRPQSASAWNLLGIILDHLDRPEEATTAFRSALAINANFIHAYNNLGVLHRKRQGYDRAIELHREAIRRAPRDAGSRYLLGLALQFQGKRDRAIEVYREALALQPKHARAHTNLGLLLAAKGDREGALEAHREAIRTDPRRINVYCNQASLLLKMGRRKEALTLIDKALSLDSRSADAHNVRGNVLRRIGRADAAIEAYQIAIELGPGDGSFRNNLAGVLSDRGDLEEALEAFEQAIAREPNRLLFLRNRGNVLARMRKWDRALAAFRRAAEVSPGDGETLVKIGRVLDQLGRFDEAVTHLEKGLERLKKDPNLRDYLMRLIRTVKKHVEAVRKVDAVLRGEAEPKDATAWVRLASLSRVTKRHVAAARLWRRAFKAHPQTAAGRNLVLAAEVATRAGCGEAEETAALDAAARTRWIEQAITWLGAWVAETCRILERGSPSDQARALRSLEIVKRNKALAGLRDPAMLGRLSAPGRRAWCALWSDLESALARRRGE